MYIDKWLRCADCGRQFMWDVGEQAWFQSNNLENQPKHCKVCRDRRRDERNLFPRRYWKAECERCGKPTYIPFLPQGIKPIYCRMCMNCIAVR
jgi:CxxC-x17-CxxC domain-containing protein